MTRSNLGQHLRRSSCWPLRRSHISASRNFLPLLRANKSIKPAGVFRQSRLEHLEPRWVLSTAPTLASLADVTLAAGTTLNIALDGYDADSDNLTFTFSISNEDISGGSLSCAVADGNRSMLISTNYGDMVFELFEDLAPETTARIIELAESDFYDGLIFHRVIDNFMIQGGDPDGDGTGGSGVTFDDEFNDLLMHTSAGVLSMAKSNDDTNDSQFFITSLSTRHLDFNHSVFGFQVEGASVRQTIEQVAVDSNDKPLTDVVMESVDIFYDYENGILRLTAPEGASGTADVTVTVSDGNGGYATRTFQVTVAADTDTSADSSPYLGDIADVETTVDTAVNFNIPASDIEGDDIYYYAGIVVDGQLYTSIDNLSISCNSSTGKVTVTPSGGISGVYSLLIGVRQQSGSDWDTQVVPLLINPAAPSGLDLLSSSDTGDSSSDNVTNLDNSTGQTMTFRITGTVSGAIVSLYADGELIGYSLASGSTTLVTTNASLTLSDGAHSFTAKQTLSNVDLEVGNRDETVDLVSPLSSSLSVTIDTVAPQFTSTAPATAKTGVLYEYQAAATDTGGGVTFSLQDGPAGMSVSAAGLVTWTPSTGQAAQQEVTILATDAAGNATPQTFTIQLQPGPNVQTVPNQTVDEGEAVSFTVVATPHGDDGPLTFSLDAGSPAGAAIDPTTGEFTWQTDENDGPGQYTVNIRVTAPSGANHVESVLISVGELNTPPLLADIADVATSEGQLVDFYVSATDADLPANELTYSLVGDVPAGAKIDAASGRFIWQPGESHGGGDYTFTVRVSDSAGGSDEKSFNISVAEIDQAPAFTPLENQVVVAGQTLAVAIAAADPDLPANPLRYSIESGSPDGLIIESDTGLISWDVPEDHPAGTFDIVIRATELPDGEEPGLSATATLRITVVPVYSAWLMFDQVLGNTALQANQENPVTHVAVNALFLSRDASGAPTLSLTARRILTPPTDAKPLISGGKLGFQLASDGSGGGQTLVDETQLEGDADKTKSDDAETGENRLDTQTPDAAAMLRVEPAVLNSKNVSTRPIQTPLAIDAAMAEFTDTDANEETAQSEEAESPKQEQKQEYASA